MIRRSSRAPEATRLVGGDVGHADLEEEPAGGPLDVVAVVGRGEEPGRRALEDREVSGALGDLALNGGYLALSTFQAAKRPSSPSPLAAAFMHA